MNSPTMITSPEPLFVVVAQTPDFNEKAHEIARHYWGEVTDAKTALALPTWYLSLGVNGLALCHATEKIKPIQVDFTHNPELLRRKQRLHSDPLIRAMGLHKGGAMPDTATRPTVWDLTAGMGQDAFLMASMGYMVHLWERNAIVHALLADGLARAQQTHCAIAMRMVLHHGSASNLCQNPPNAPLPESIYIDPMFPSRNKTALPNKAMQALHTIVGHDDDADALLAVAQHYAKQRVVVKRPKLAPPLANKPPKWQHLGPTIRFDAYLPEHTV